ncbi:MAG: ABC transporter substrate-binding protein [Gammaproteobacteria bacterium]|nr:ABC transporter substrate-binding protein [Gammaproteobacteria bacterium]
MKRMFVLFVLAALIAPLSAWANDPKSRTEGFVDAMKASKEKDEASYKRIDDFIDYQTITAETVAPHSKKFSSEQMSAFQRDLTALIRIVAYPQSGKFYKEAKYKYREAQMKGKVAVVIQDTYLPSEDLEMEIGYQLAQIDGKWRITDITFDGDSMVKDYQNQFGRIIAKDGVNGLNKRIQDKFKELNK